MVIVGLSVFVANCMKHGHDKIEEFAAVPFVGRGGTVVTDRWVLFHRHLIRCGEGQNEIMVTPIGRPAASRQHIQHLIRPGD